MVVLLNGVLMKLFEEFCVILLKFLRFVLES